MIKIINGKIVRDETAAGVTSNSPIVTRRRSSLQELQLKEFQLQQEQQKAQEASESTQAQQVDLPPASWKDISSQSIRVFGMKMNIKILLTVSILSVIGAGVMGLLCSLLAVYLGTLFTTQNLSSSPTASPPSSPVEQDSTATVNKSSPPPLNGAQQILKRRNSISRDGTIISAFPSSPLSSPSLSLRSPRISTLRSIAEAEKLPMLDSPVC
eukprot:TRINITY_DN1294_c0_g1_i1.p1 TRINITY_DN1294_c0_g1~~TRINITY_DN1294_c0_g1_i1.p1  ORF type:complete len:212 (-),score=74.84 TRINITY_DN1294_c0_g1_i1:247-882(-)